LQGVSSFIELNIYFKEGNIEDTGLSISIMEISGSDKDKEDLLMT